jgi:hypothetical protein
MLIALAGARNMHGACNAMCRCGGILPESQPHPSPVLLYVLPWNHVGVQMLDLL